MNDHIETDTLATLIGKKHDVLVQLRELSRRQSDLIHQGDMNKLLALLAAKQKLLNELQDIDSNLGPFRQQDPDQRIWPSATDRERCRQTAQRCEALLGEIMIVEKQSEADLIVRRDQAAEKLQGIHTASEARTAYAQGSEQSFGDFDLTSQT